MLSLHDGLDGGLARGYAFSLSALTSARISGVQRASSFCDRSPTRHDLLAAAWPGPPFSTLPGRLGRLGRRWQRLAGGGRGRGGGGGGPGGDHGGGGSTAHAARRETRSAERKRLRFIFPKYSFVRPATNTASRGTQNMWHSPASARRRRTRAGYLTREPLARDLLPRRRSAGRLRIPMTPKRRKRREVRCPYRFGSLRERSEHRVRASLPAVVVPWLHEPRSNGVPTSLHRRTEAACSEGARASRTRLFPFPARRCSRPVASRNGTPESISMEDRVDELMIWTRCGVVESGPDAEGHMVYPVDTVSVPANRGRGNRLLQCGVPGGEENVEPGTGPHRGGTQALVVWHNYGTGNIHGWKLIDVRGGRARSWKQPDFCARPLGQTGRGRDIRKTGRAGCESRRRSALVEGHLVYRAGEPNCCPSGGVMRVQLGARTARYSLSGFGASLCRNRDFRHGRVTGLALTGRSPCPRPRPPASWSHWAPRGTGGRTVRVPSRCDNR